MRGQDCSRFRSSLEHREVQSETKMCRVCWRKLSDGHIRGAVIRVE